MKFRSFQEVLRQHTLQPAEFRIVNRTRNAVLSSSSRLAAHFLTRFWGLLRISDIELRDEVKALRIEPCSQIHTFFMRYSIDVVFYDTRRRIVGIEPNLKPFRFSKRIKDAFGVIELYAGALSGQTHHVGDELEFEEMTNL